MKQLSHRALFALVAAVVVGGGVSACSTTQHPLRSEDPPTFETPDIAAAAVVQALSSNNSAELVTTLGVDSDRDLISGDAVADANDRKRVVDLYNEAHKSEITGESATLFWGYREWPFPFPLVRSHDRWHFAAEEGVNELADRRIGRNELSAIQTCRSVVAAQEWYSVRDHDRDGVYEYASKIVSTPGKKDGLVWLSTADPYRGPLAPLLESAANEGYSSKGDTKPSPFHGYLFRMLTAQGSQAPGGKDSYLDARGRMTGGFALVAYPAEYQKSGVMTFMVSQSGTVYQRDLGEDTAKLAEAMQEYNPDSSWKIVPLTEGSANS